MFWKLVNILNETLVGALTQESKESKETEDLKSQWEKRIYYSSDEQLERYLYEHGLQYYSIKDYGRYKIEKMLIDYMVKNEIKPYYI